MGIGAVDIDSIVDSIDFDDAMDLGIEDVSDYFLSSEDETPHTKVSAKGRKSGNKSLVSHRSNSVYQSRETSDEYQVYDFSDR